MPRSSRASSQNSSEQSPRPSNLAELGRHSKNFVRKFARNERRKSAKGSVEVMGLARDQIWIVEMMTRVGQ